MTRIKITGYVEVADMDPDHVDLEHETGLTEEGFTKMGYERVADLEDLEIELEKE